MQGFASMMGSTHGRRARALAASLAVLLLGSAFYARNVQPGSGARAIHSSVVVATLPAPCRRAA